MIQQANPQAAPNEMWHRFRRWNFRTFRPAKFAGLQQKRGPFDEHRCIFVHIPKCAGISVVRSLFGDFSCGHGNLKRYQIMFAPEEFNRYFKFTVVRNPFDRLVSAFLFMKKGGINDKDKRWAERNLAPYADFDAFVKGWVNRDNLWKGLHFRPQHSFICLKKYQPGLDFIGYYENLAADFDFICRKLEIKSTLIEANRNLSRKRIYTDYYTDESRAIVADAYADDLRVLGYNFDNSSLPDNWRGAKAAGADSGTGVPPVSLWQGSAQGLAEAHGRHSGIFNPAQTNSVIVFLHIHKTGGTSFRSILEKNFGASCCHTNQTRCEHFSQADLAFVKKLFPRLRAITGHNLVDPLQLTVADPFYATFLREPVARVISHYQDKVLRGTNRATFAESLKTNTRLNNWQVKLMAARESLAGIAQGLAEAHGRDARATTGT